MITENYRNSWSIVPLGDFAFHEKGKKPKNQKPDKDEEYKYPYVDIAAFEKGIVKSYTDGFKCNICSEADFLMVWDGARSGLVGKGIDGALGSTLVRITFPKINNDYAFYYLKSKYQQINTRSKGTGTPHVDPSLLWNYQFPIAPLPEQRAIVSKIEQLFSELDNGIKNLKTSQKQLKVYRQAVLKKAFEGELTKEWREKQTDLPTADELLEQIKTERKNNYQKQLDDWAIAVKEWEVGGKEGKKPGKPKIIKNIVSLTTSEILLLDELPDRWGWIKLGQIVKSSCLGKMLDKKNNKGSYEAYLGNINVRWGKFDLNNLKEMRFEPQELKRFSLVPGDLVICEGGEPGRCAVWRFNQDIKIQKALHRVRFYKTSISSGFIYYFFRFTSQSKLIDKYFTGTTIKHLTGQSLNRFPVPLCSAQEQTQIVQEIESRLSVCDKIEEIIKENLSKSEALRQSILKKAFEGKLLSDSELEACRLELDWEPASELLKKIKGNV